MSKTSDAIGKDLGSGDFRTENRAAEAMAGGLELYMDMLINDEAKLGELEAGSAEYKDLEKKITSRKDTLRTLRKFSDKFRPWIR